MIAQVGRTVFGDSSPLFYILQLFTALILVLAANTAFNGFPVLTSILAHDGYAPRSCAPAATGSRTPTASCCCPGSRSC